MQKFNLSRKLFDFEEQDSDHSTYSVIYTSSDSEEDVSDSCDSDRSTDSEALINWIEREVKSSPILIGGRAMNVEGLEDETVAGSSILQPDPSSTPKLDPKYFDKNLCYAPPRKIEKTKIELCKTLLPIQESHLACLLLLMKEGPHKTFLNHILWIWAVTLRTIYKAHSRMQT